MRTHSNWSNNATGASNLYYTKEETIADVQSNFDYRRFYSAEGCALMDFRGLVKSLEPQHHLQ